LGVTLLQRRQFIVMPVAFARYLPRLPVCLTMKSREDEREPTRMETGEALVTGAGLPFLLVTSLASPWLLITRREVPAHF
jgi:hypothetical protein